MFGIKNPQSLLQPWQSLTQFTEELYAALTSGPEAPTPVVNQVEGQPPTPATVPPVAPSVQAVASPSVLGRARPAPTLADFQSKVEPPPPTPNSLSIAWPTTTAPPQSARRQKHPDQATGNTRSTEIAETTEAAGKEIGKHKRRPGYLGEAIYAKFPPVENRAPQSAAGLMGRVIAGEGDRYAVQLYSDGPDGAPDIDGLIDVRVPQIADGEKIPVGTWCQPILDTGDVFVYQPPIWIG